MSCLSWERVGELMSSLSESHLGITGEAGVLLN